MDVSADQTALSSRIRWADLPLAVYREVMAHLHQVEGITVALIPQRSPQFDYSLSQIDSLQIEYTPDISAANREQVQQILAYYSDRYGAWETVKSPEM